MSKPVLIVDHDDCISDLNTPLLNFYNFEAKDNLTKEQITDWDLSEFVKPEFKKRIYEYFHDPLISRVIFHDAKPQDGAVEVTEWLQQYFDLWVVSATHPYNVKIKAEWLERYLPHISITQRYCVLPDKALFKADWIFDDKYQTVSLFKHGSLFSQPWNLKYEHPRRMKGWYDYQNYIQRLINLGIINKEGVA